MLEHLQKIEIKFKVEFIVFGVQTSNDVRNNLKQIEYQIWDMHYDIC
jgi:hypothetical protein